MAPFARLGLSFLGLAKNRSHALAVTRDVGLNAQLHQPPKELHNAKVRFNLDEVMAWARRCASEVDDQGLDALQNFETGSGSQIQAKAKLPA